MLLFFFIVKSDFQMRQFLVVVAAKGNKILIYFITGLQECKLNLFILLRKIYYLGHQGRHPSFICLEDKKNLQKCKLLRPSYSLFILFFILNRPSLWLEARAHSNCIPTHLLHFLSFLICNDTDKDPLSFVRCFSILSVGFVFWL